MTARQYSAEQRAEAVGLAQSVGPTEAARRLGVPHRTVSDWLARPDMQAIVLRSRDEVAAKLWEAVCIGVDEVLRRMRDPRQRLGDVARALEVVSERHALLTGGATAHVAHANVSRLEDQLTDDERRVVIEAARDYLAEQADAAPSPWDRPADRAPAVALVDPRAVARRIEQLTDAELEQQAPALIADLDAAGVEVPEWLREEAEAGHEDGPLYVPMSYFDATHGIALFQGEDLADEIARRRAEHDPKLRAAGMDPESIWAEVLAADRAAAEAGDE